MNQKIKKLEKDIEQLGRKNDDMTLIVRMGKIAELIDEYKKIITNRIPVSSTFPPWRGCTEMSCWDPTRLLSMQSRVS